MSKIAEKRVNELGYSKDTFNREEFTANDIFYCGVECYDQATQDFLEKTEKFLSEKVQDYFWWNQEKCFVDFDKEECLKGFKSYMKDESEN